MVNKNKKQLSNTNVLSLIDFLKKEFSLCNVESFKKTERKVVQSLNNKTITTKENFHKIGKLIDDALKHLPDADDLPKDHDEKHSHIWQNHQKKIKKDLLTQKTCKPHTDILFTGSGGNIKCGPSYSYNWKTLSLAFFLFSIILMNCFFCLQPKTAYKLLSYADNLLEPKSQSVKTVKHQKILNIKQEEISKAKIQYIINNSNKIQNQKSIGVTAKDLFGLNADASTDENVIVAKPAKPSIIENISETVKISWINFFKELF